MRQGLQKSIYSFKDTKFRALLMRGGWTLTGARGIWGFGFDEDAWPSKNADPTRQSDDLSGNRNIFCLINNAIRFWEGTFRSEANTSVTLFKIC